MPSTSASVEEPEYEVLRVLDVRTNEDGQLEYKVKWKDQGKKKWSRDKHDTWQEESTLACPDLVAAFIERRRLEGQQPSERERERSSSSARQTERKAATNLRRAAAKGEEEAKDDDEAPRTDRKKKKKRVIIESDDDEEESRSTSRSRSKTAESKDDESSYLRRSGRGAKRTGERDSAGPSSSSSHRPSHDPPSSSSFVVPSTPKLKAPKPEPISPEKRAEPQSAITSDTQLKKFNGRHGEKLRPEKKQAHESAMKLEKRKKSKKKNRRGAQPLQPPAEHDEAGPSLFNTLPPTPVVKAEMHGDSSFDGMEEGMGRMGMEEEFNLDGDDDDDDDEEEEETLLEQRMLAVKKEESREGHHTGDRDDEERSVETPETVPFAENQEGREEAVETPGAESNAVSVDPVNEDEEEGEERSEEYQSVDGDSMEDDYDSDRLYIDEGEENEQMEGGETNEEPVVANEEEDEEMSDEEEMDVLNFNPHPTGRCGYDDGLTGTVVDNASFLFDNGEEVDFFRVVFLALDRSQWIRREIVREKDILEYNRYMLKLAADHRRETIAQGAANYRAARARIEREQREQREAIVRVARGE